MGGGIGRKDRGQLLRAALGGFLIVALTAVPRIAIIPIIVVLFGPTLKASVLTSITVVFFPFTSTWRFRMSFAPPKRRCQRR